MHIDKNRKTFQNIFLNTVITVSTNIAYSYVVRFIHSTNITDSYFVRVIDFCCSSFCNSVIVLLFTYWF